MKTRALVVMSCAALLLPAAVTAATPQRVPRGAYVRKPVSCVDDLAAHIRRDPVVRNRFARHFGVPTAQLDQYIRDNVIITRVTSSTPRSVYVVTGSGRLVAQRKVLKKGTTIFALKDTGEPLLVQACGNPVVKALPPRVKVKAVEPQVFQVMRPKEDPPPPVAYVPPVVATPPAPPAALPPVVPVAAVPPAAVVPPVAVAKGPNLLPLLAIPIVGGVIGGGGGGGNNPPPPPPPPPIPEPGGVAAVFATTLLPAAGYAVRRLRNRRSAGA